MRSSVDFEKQPVRLPARQQEGPLPEAAGFWLAAQVLCVMIATSLPTYRTYENLLKLVQFCFVLFFFLRLHQGHFRVRLGEEASEKTQRARRNDRPGRPKSVPATLPRLEHPPAHLCRFAARQPTNVLPPLRSCVGTTSLCDTACYVPVGARPRDRSPLSRGRHR